ncbi:MAG: pullulanase-associated domain-containing protein, partial [Rhodoluna sp.]
MRISASPKRLLGLILSLLVMLTGLVAVDAQPSSAAGDKKVIIHYVRSDIMSQGGKWNVWMWWDGADGKAYEFNKSGLNYALDSDGNAVGEWVLPGSANAQAVGFIIRTGNWDKDPDGDRFIRNFKDVNGVQTAEIWVKSGSKFIWTKKPSAEPMLLAARVVGLKEIKLTFDNNFNLDTEKANFTLKDSVNEPVSVSSFSPLTGNASAGYTTTMTLTENLRIGSVYTVSHPVYGEQESDLGSLWNLQEFNDQFYYDGNDLGNTYSATKTDFRVWAPTSDQLQLVTYASASATEPSSVNEMTKSVKGTWTYTLNGNQDGTIYMYRAKFGNKVNEAIDPYVRATTINGNRGVVVDLNSTDPVGWDEHQRPNNFNSGNPTDAIVYELHVRDLSIDKTSGISANNKGKYLAFTEPNTKYTSKGKSTLTGLASMKDLGVTHVELLPVYDFGSVDETGEGNQFNWGYDPKNYNVPEGSYSSNPADPKARIRELKTAIKAMHDNKLRVIMDVVYNHVQD